MDYFGYAYFVERPRRIEDLMVPHPIEKERPYRIVTEIHLPAIDYENFITDMLADRQFIEDHGRRCKKGEVRSAGFLWAVRSRWAGWSPRCRAWPDRRNS